MAKNGFIPRGIALFLVQYYEFLTTYMNTITKTKNLLHDFFHVGPATKGWTVEIVLGFLMLLSLAVFLFFSSNSNLGKLKADTTVIPQQQELQ